MSVNAFYQSMGGIQNALGDPRGDAERRAIQQRQMQMQEMEFAAKQQEAQRVAQQRQAEQARQQAVFGFRSGSMFPNGQRPAPMPQGGQMSAPQMAGQAPQAITAQPMAGQPQQIAGPMPPQAPQMDAQGREIDMVTVTGERRGPMPAQEDELTFRIRDAFDRGDVEGFNQFFELKRSTMSEQEKAGRQQISAAAGQILRLPAEQRGQAVLQAMQRFGVDPSSTQIDDYNNDPAKLEQALRFEMVMGAPDDAGKEAIRVQGTFDQYRAPEIRDFGGSIGAVGTMPANAGRIVGTAIRKTVDPNSALSAQTQRRGQDVQAAMSVANRASQQTIARIQANTRMSEGEKNRQVQRERTRAAREIAVLTGKIELGDEVGADEFAN